MNQWSVSPGCATPGHKSPSPQRHKYTTECHRTTPSSNQPSQVPWGNHCGSDNRDCHTHTTSQNHCSQAGRNTIGAWLCTRPRHRDCVHMPDTGLHPHRESKHKQHTRSQGHRAVCPSATHMSIRNRDRTKPSRNAVTAAQTHWYQSTMWRGHTRSTTSPKERKRRGASAKSSVLRLTCVPLPHLVLPLSGCACSGTPTMATRGEARGHP